MIKITVDYGTIQRPVEMYTVPAEFSDYQPLEVLWCIEQVHKVIANHELELTDQQFIDLIWTIVGNHESVDQDITWRIEEEMYAVGLIEREEVNEED